MSFSSDIAGSGVTDFSSLGADAADVADPAIGVLLNFLSSPDTAGTGNEGIIVDLINFKDIFRDFSQGILWVLGQVYGAWAWTQPLARQIGKDFETIQGNDQAAVLHLKDTILPHSLKWLQGYIFSTGIVPLRVEVAKLTDRVSFLEGWRGQINTWRHDQVDPTLKEWRQFHSWFDNNAAPIIATVTRWIKQPATFADFATPIIARPLVTYMATDAHKILRDDLSTLMVDAWSDRPNTVWESILQWVITD